MTAQGAFDAPHAVHRPRLEADRLVVAALGVPEPGAARDETFGRAKHMARRLAREQLHRFVDDHLAALAVTAWDAQAIHEAVAAHMAVVSERLLVDGAVIVGAALPVEALRAAAPVAGAPWEG